MSQKPVVYTVSEGAPIDLQVEVRPPIGYQPFAAAATATWRYRKKGSNDAATEVALVVATDLVDVNNCRWKLPLSATDTATAQALEVELVVTWSSGSPDRYVSRKDLLTVEIKAAIP